MMAQLWRTALAAHPDVHVVANADDPMVVWAAINTAHVTWFSAGQRWHDDSWVCPECGSPDRARQRRLVVHRLPAAPPAGPVDRRGRRRRRPRGRLAPGQAATARPGQPGQRGHRAGRRRRVRRTPARGGAPAGHGHLGGRPVRPGRAGRPQHPAAAGQEPGQLAGGVRHGRRGADPALHQRPRPRRLRHLLAVRRRLLPAARPPGADHRRPGVRPGRPAGGERCAVPARTYLRRGDPGRRRRAGSR